MKKLILPLIAFTFMTTGCNTSKNEQSGINPQNLDTSVSPKVDFYQFACGGWMKNNPLTGEYSRFGSFDQLAENNRKQLNLLIEEIAAKTHTQGTIEQKIGTLYNQALDSVKRNEDGIAPILPDFKRISSLKDTKEIVDLLPELLLSGIDAYFTVYVDADPMNSTQYMLQTYQSGLGLGQRDYYLDEDEKTVEIREAYKKHIIKMFELYGFNSQEAEHSMQAVMNIETALAKAAYDKVKLRDPYANYNKMPLEKLQSVVPAIDWQVYFSALGVKEITEINLSQIEPLEKVNELLQKEPMESHISYLQWKLIDQTTSYLDDKVYDLNFDFYGKILSGKEEQQARWKRAVSAVNGTLGEAVGQMYVKKYFPPAAKERMVKLVGNLQTALGERIANLDWMSDETKVRAQEKLATFHVKIGYPDKWRDYSLLEIADDSYYENMKRASRFEAEYMFTKAGKTVDKDEWLMTPQTVNAYYNPSTNEICFPAGILQYPFFDMNADDAFNYGAIGVVIGHEMTHGFDDQGRQYDKDGNLKDWWSEEDGKKFEERAKVMADYFDQIEVAPNTKANGKFTLGENIADYGGLKVAFQAFENATKNTPLKNIDDFTPEQRFFIAYATVWAGNIRPEEILVRTKSDPHSLGRWRVNGQMPHNNDWYKAFGVSKTDPMYLAPEKRVNIW